jgi:hypothetical protein
MTEENKVEEKPDEIGKKLEGQLQNRPNRDELLKDS